MLQRLSDWLTGQPASEWVANILWIIPMVQTVHILALAVVLTAMIMIDLQLIGVVRSRHPVRLMMERSMPWVWLALAVMAASGAVMITGEPARSLLNPMFQLKMLMLVGVVLLTVAMQAALRSRQDIWNAPLTGAGTRLIGVVSLVLWVGIAAAGRWIAYVDG